MNLWNETRSVPISRPMVWEAYKKVKANNGSAGVDEIDMSEYDANRSKHLYKLWNRMASGSYFPPPVKEVEITKKDGGIRKLGIPTISDRVGQMVIKDYIEPRLEKIFSENSYGYRPNRDAHQALESVRLNCWKYDWVIDLDIKGFFDNINHNKLMLAVEKHVPENWVRLYVKRWLETPVLTKSGELIIKEGKGTPQGGVISPLLANLFLHYTFDKWLELTDSTVSFARYADDAIIHCKSKQHAERILKLVHERMGACGLELHPVKTKIVYCRDFRRKGKHKEVKFDFLGFSFQPRTTKSKKTGKLFLGYDCAISISSRKRLADELGELKIERMTFKSVVGIAQRLNSIIQGWINYYGKFRGYELSKVFRLLRIRIVRWARKRYKRYRTSLTKACKWLDRVRIQYPNLFYHWQVGYSN
jgi:group II intron reverse transcriptase/maturase